MTTNSELLKIARKYLGYDGSIFRKFCGLGKGQAYCNAFVCYIADKGKVAKLYFDGKKETYCPSSYQWCKKNLAQLPPYLSLAMDIAYFDWDKNGVPNHIGFVTSRRDTNSIHTLEGNTSKLNDKGKVVAKNVVAERVRAASNTQAIFRPHFPAKFELKKLDEDGKCGYNTIANLQKALGLKPTGIFDRATLMALQKKAGAKQDAWWGRDTSKLVQKMIGAKQDGKFGKKSVVKLQRWINAKNYPAKKSTKTKTTTTAKPAAKVLTKPEKAVAWAKDIAKGKKYTYKKWKNNDKKTKLCPICNKLTGKYKGWNCIGFVSAAYFHGAGLKTIKCSCSGIGTDSFFTKVTLASWKKRNGKDWTMITNGGKKSGADIPASKFKPGDILICYDAKGKFHHVVLYTGNSKYIDCTNTSKNHIAERNYSTITKKYHVTRAFRYTGK